jgi:hypothetical protein
MRSAAEVARLLWPEPWGEPRVTRNRHRVGTSHRDAYLFPSERRPRMLVPADVSGSWSMVRRLGAGRRSPVARPVQGLLERAVRSRAFVLAGWPMLQVPAPDRWSESIETYLSGVLDSHVRVGILLGTPRVNQKPVLQVFDVEGRLLGYAKVGHNELTAALVQREAQALSVVGGRRPQSFRVPRVLHAGQWGGLEVLVLSALPSDPREPVTLEARLDAVCELARLDGSTQSPLAASGFWARLRAETARLAGEPSGARLVAAADVLERAHGDDPVELGSWHGDWGHWNMGSAHGVLRVWDWERYDAEVPVGFDALHYLAQLVRPGERQQRRQEEEFEQAVPRTLSEMGVRDDRHELTVTLYLLEIAARYLDALAFGTTAALLRRTEWVLSQLERRVDDRRPALLEGRP